MLVTSCSRPAEPELEPHGEDPDALGGEPAEFQGFEASKPISAFAPLSSSPRQLSANFASGGMVAGARVVPYRSFVQSGAEWWVVADIDSLRTAVVPRAWLEANTVLASLENSSRERHDARYRATNTPVNSVAKADTAGATRVALTVDMCQSSKPWDRALFEWAMAQGVRRGAPLSINVAMTGIWAKHHAAEFTQLQTWRKQGQLDITWVNHSFRHPLHCSGSSCAFLTAPSENTQSAVLLEGNRSHGGLRSHAATC